MYTINNIIEELNNRGLNATTQVVTKNGIELNAVVIKSEAKNIAATIDVDEILESINNGEISFEDAISHMVTLYNGRKDVAFDDSVLRDKDFILSNLYIGLQREGTEELVKRECGFDGIEAYLYIRLEQFEDGIGTAKVNRNLLDLVEISEAEAWKRAEENTFSETTMQPIFSAIGALVNEEFPEEELIDESCGLYVLSNKSMNLGASAILDKKALQRLSEKVHTKEFIMIPSSRHEVIVVPNTGNIELEDVTEMVNMVNSNEVRPIDQLADKAYAFAI